MTGPVTLSDVLADAPVVKWIMAKIDSVQASEHAVTLAYHGGQIPHVAYLESYVPAIGDVVHALIDQRNGLVVLGKEVLRTPPPPPTPGAPTTVNPTGQSSYFQVPLPPHWSGTVVQQGPEVSGAFFYGTAVTAAGLPAGMVLGRFEIRLTLSADSGPLSMMLIDNADTSSAFQPVSAMYLHQIFPATDTWVALPLSWGTALINGDAQGIGLASDLYSATVTAGGTLRFTPL